VGPVELFDERRGTHAGRGDACGLYAVEPADVFREGGDRRYHLGCRETQRTATAQFLVPTNERALLAAGALEAE
jgi:hypothetical protein